MPRYSHSQLGYSICKRAFLGWCLSAVWQSAAIYFLAYNVDRDLAVFGNLMCATTHVSNILLARQPTQNATRGCCSVATSTAGPRCGASV